MNLDQFMLTQPGLEWTGPASECRCGCVGGKAFEVVFMFRTEDSAHSAIQALCDSPHSIGVYIFRHTSKGILVTDN